MVRLSCSCSFALVKVLQCPFAPDDVAGLMQEVVDSLKDGGCLRVGLGGSASTSDGPLHSDTAVASPKPTRPFGPCRSWCSGWEVLETELCLNCRANVVEVLVDRASRGEALILTEEQA